MCFLVANKPDFCIVCEGSVQKIGTETPRNLKFSLRVQGKGCYPCLRRQCVFPQNAGIYRLCRASPVPGVLGYGTRQLRGKSVCADPVLGRMNHDEVLQALVDVGFQGYFTLECFWSMIRYDQITGERWRFQKDGKTPRLGEPQLFMQRHMEAMMYDTAKWMLEEYHLFEA